LIIVLVYFKDRSSRMPIYVWDELYFFKGSYSIRITQWSRKVIHRKHLFKEINMLLQERHWWTNKEKMCIQFVYKLCIIFVYMYSTVLVFFNDTCVHVWYMLNTNNFNFEFVNDFIITIRFKRIHFSFFLCLHYVRIYVLFFKLVNILL
jgi:hypothetical protein